MAGLLGKTAKLRGLLAGMMQDPVVDPRLGGPTAAPAMAAAAPSPNFDAMTERYGREGQRKGLLSALEPQPVPERNRVSGWRVLDGVLGGKTVTESLDGERARETALAQGQQGDPMMRAIAATITDPNELAVFLASPEDWAKNSAEFYSPQVVGAGAAQVRGGVRTVDQPQNIQSGDSIVQVGSGGANSIFTRTTPSISEGIASRGVDVQATNAETGRINAGTSRFVAENPVIGSGATWVDPSGQVRAQGYIAPVTVADGSEVRDPVTGQLVAENVASRPAPTAPAPVIEARGRIASLESDVFPVLDRQEQLLKSGSVITGPLAGPRLQAARVAASMGDQQAQRQVAATEEYVANAGRLITGLAKTLGPNPTDRDAAIIERTVGGDLNASTEGLLATIGQAYGLADRQRTTARGVVSGWEGQSRAPAAGGPVRVNSPQEAAALPPGTPFIGHDGILRVRQ